VDWWVWRLVTHEKRLCSGLAELDTWGFDDADQAHAVLDMFDRIAEERARELDAKKPRR
jgi:hypothetical protein